MRLSLVVLRSTNPDRLAAFYRSIGLPMVQERHGTGPLHFAGTLESGVIEIYPAKASTQIMFGIAVSDREAFTRAWVEAGGLISPQQLLIDPEGNRIHLSVMT